MRIYFLTGVLDGYSRYIVHHEFREAQKETAFGFGTKRKNLRGTMPRFDRQKPRSRFRQVKTILFAENHGDGRYVKEREGFRLMVAFSGKSLSHVSGK